jgi:hypothetical protein
MSELGLALLKLVDEQGRLIRADREAGHKQLIRFIGKYRQSRKKYGARLELAAAELRKTLAQKGLRRLLQPWRRYSDQRQLVLVEALLSCHRAEAEEAVKTLEALARTLGSEAEGESGG